MPEKLCDALGLPASACQIWRSPLKYHGTVCTPLGEEGERGMGVLEMGEVNIGLGVKLPDTFENVGEMRETHARAQCVGPLMSEQARPTSLPASKSIM